MYLGLKQLMIIKEKHRFTSDEALGEEFTAMVEFGKKTIVKIHSRYRERFLLTLFLVLHETAHAYFKELGLARNLENMLAKLPKDKKFTSKELCEISPCYFEKELGLPRGLWDIRMDAHNRDTKALLTEVLCDVFAYSAIKNKGWKKVPTKVKAFVACVINDLYDDKVPISLYNHLAV